MKDYRPLLLQQLDVRLPGIRILRLRLHRHLPEADALEDHRHRFSQTLCYLSGRGTLRMDGEERQVFAGGIVLVPSGSVHGFREGDGRRPLSLAIDFSGPPGKHGLVGQLNESETSRIRRQLSELNRLKDPSGPDARLLASAAALAILDIQLRALGVLDRGSQAVPGFVQKFSRLAADPRHYGKSIAQLAVEAGNQPDYLNRKFKQATGLTLRQQRDSARLLQAKRALKKRGSVQEAAFDSGFEDPSYFSRWFKRQVGMTPREFAG